MIEMESHNLSVIIEAHVEKYGEAAREKAIERSDDLLDFGDRTGSDIWKQVAAVIRQREDELAG